jgi:hypothetical protein
VRTFDDADYAHARPRIGGRREFVPIPSDVTVSSAGIALAPYLLKAGAVAAEADLDQPGKHPASAGAGQVGDANPSMSGASVQWKLPPQ